MNWLKQLLLSDMDARVKDLERHFVTKRDDSGRVTETLADVPLSERKERQLSTRGLSWTQRRAMLEATDGGRRLG